MKKSIFIIGFQTTVNNYAHQSWLNYGESDLPEFWTSVDWLKEDWKKYIGNNNEKIKIDFDALPSSPYIFFGIRTHCTSRTAVNPNIYLFDASFEN